MNCGICSDCCRISGDLRHLQARSTEMCRAVHKSLLRVNTAGMES